MFGRLLKGTFCRSSRSRTQPILEGLVVTALAFPPSTRSLLEGTDFPATPSLQ